MKRSNLKVGLRVLLKKDTLGLDISEFIGREFTISDVEREEYNGDLTVAIDGRWCNHRDLKRVKEEAPKPEIGALFVVTGRTTPCHCFAVGTVVRCAEAPHPVGKNCRYEDTDGALQFVSLSDLKPLSLADIQAALNK